jgi:hypothetical protein
VDGATEAGASEPGIEVGATDGATAPEPGAVLAGFGALAVGPGVGPGVLVDAVGPFEPHAPRAAARTRPRTSVDRAIERLRAIDS